MTISFTPLPSNTFNYYEKPGTLGKMEHAYKNWLEEPSNFNVYPNLYLSTQNAANMASAMSTMNNNYLKGINRKLDLIGDKLGLSRKFEAIG